VLTLEVEYHGDDTMHHLVRVPVTSGEFAVERLRVNRRYVDAPDSALQRRIARERELSRAVYARSPDTPRLWSGPFARPLPGRVTSRFGTRREFNGELRSRHWGVDLDGDRGDPVLAANRGVVALVGDFYYSGNVVYLDHGRGLITAYLHLSQVDVAPGDTLERGSLVGRVGATGRVTGPHLHWLVRFAGVSLDGLKLLELDVSGFVEPEAVPRAVEPVAASR
jgi:murein DD-endopeptidase MepM/ murein hydrolase activator NlpD